MTQSSMYQRKPSSLLGKHILKAIILYGIILTSLLHSQRSLAQVIEFETSIRADYGKLVTEKSFVIQVNGKESEWLSDIEISFSEGEKVDILEAVIIDAYGNEVRKLKKKEVETVSDISNGTFYQDDFVKKFQLKWSSYPYRIKYSYQKTVTDFIYVARWTPLIFRNVPVYHASLQIEMPLEYPVKIDVKGEFTEHKEEREKNVVYTWKSNKIIPPESEVFAPNLVERLPFVTVVPQKFRYGIEGDFSSWQSYGEWHERLNEESDILPDTEKRKVDQLIDGVDNPKEIVRILYHYLQDNTRYVNVAIDVGGLKPYPASYVCENKYGDCKALTIYMKALLKYAGIPSYYTIIYGDSNPIRVNHALPSQQFNHVILNVPIGNDTIWLENTSNYLPFGYLGTFTQNRYSLSIDGESSKLVHTPILEKEEVVEKSFCHFQLGIDGKGMMQMREVLRGDRFEDYSYLQKMASKEEMLHYFKRGFNSSAYEVKDWQVTQKNRDSAEITITAELLVDNQIREVAGMFVLKPAAIFNRELEEPEKRISDVRINFPLYRIDSTVYTISNIENYQVELSAPVKIQSTYGSFEERIELVKGDILVFREFYLKSGAYPVSEYEQFYAFIQQVENKQKNSFIILKP